ncbi:MAG: hypothetical protein ABSE86_28245 [Bryobacteraceae bacterium]|jgi:hypothetical protein
MYQKVLVEGLKEDGRLLVEALERNRFPITAAVWYDYPEAQWRLVVVSPAVDLVGPMAAYSRVQRALRSVERTELTLSDISLLSPRSQEFQNLRSLVSAPGRHGSGRTRDVVLEDAYVYRM